MGLVFAFVVVAFMGFCAGVVAGMCWLESTIKKMVEEDESND